MWSLAARVLVMLACIQVAGASSFDGLPRPKGFPYAPTTAYGNIPAVYDGDNQTVNCAWYGWANVNFPSDIGLQCLAYDWEYRILSETGHTKLVAYGYYTCFQAGLCRDDVWDSDYCGIGCFYLSNSSFAIPPISVPPPLAPPPRITSPPTTTAPPATPNALMPPSSNGGTQPPAPPGPPSVIDTAPRLSTGTFHQADVVLVFCSAIAVVAGVNIFNWC